MPAWRNADAAWTLPPVVTRSRWPGATPPLAIDCARRCRMMGFAAGRNNELAPETMRKTSTTRRNAALLMCWKRLRPSGTKAIGRHAEQRGAAQRGNFSGRRPGGMPPAAGEGKPRGEKVAKPARSIWLILPSGKFFIGDQRIGAIVAGRSKAKLPIALARLPWQSAALAFPCTRSPHLHRRSSVLPDGGHEPRR